MPRGVADPVGTRRKRQNGYWETKTKLGWERDHNIIAEQKLGRPLDHSKEWAYFIDGDKDNLSPDNIEVRPVRSVKIKRSLQLRTQVKKLRQDLDTFTARLEAVERELSE